MSQIEKMIDKLQIDMNTILESGNTNKELTLKRLESTINDLKNIDEGKLLCNLPTEDRRALKYAKECAKDNKLVDETFGPEMMDKFSNVLGLFITSAVESVSVHCAKNMAALMIYQISRKIKSSSKSFDYKSLVYKGYVIKLMIDLEIGSKESMDYMLNVFIPVAARYAHNSELLNILKNEKNVLYTSAQSVK